MMHHAIAIEENTEQNLHIWSNLTWFFCSWLFWTLTFAWMGFGFNVIALHPWFGTNYGPFEQKVLRKTFVKITWHEPNDMPTSSATSVIVIRRLSKIIFFTASMFPSVFDVLKRAERALSLTSSWPSLNLKQLNLCSAHSILAPNATVNISNILKHLISVFYTKLNIVSLNHFIEL